MPEIAMLIGGAGTGKTSRLMEIMDKVIETGLDPTKIGFVSFTRAARREAASRAASRFNIKQEQLEQAGWFRTLHSVCYRCLGIQKDQMISGTKSDKDWLQESIQEPISLDNAGENDDGLAEVVSSEYTPADIALKLWQASRNRLAPLEEVWAKASATDSRTPDLEFCTDVSRRYELAKQAVGKLDFTDLLSQFAGWRCGPSGAERATPAGFCPELPVWFFDEQQDTSALLDSVCHRLIASARWVYVVGDAFQAIYGWAGADPKYFLAWPAKKRETMPKSYRCPAPILELGERILEQCSNYWDRKISPADHGGVVETGLLGAMLGEVDPTDSWLVLGRTNREVGNLCGRLNKLGIPWRPTKGNGGWSAPVRNAAMKALYDLETGNPIDGGQWKQVLKILPAKGFLEHGTKKRFEDTEYKAAELHPWVMLGDVGELGATADLRNAIASGRWPEIVEDGRLWADAVAKWGAATIDRLNVQVGTIHSVKGAEANNVLLSTSITKQIERSQEDESGYDEERRVEYVAVTRARKRLLVADDHRAFLKMRLPL